VNVPVPAPDLGLPVIDASIRTATTRPDYEASIIGRSRSVTVTFTFTFT
jgi:hypothetical protein